MARNSLSRVRVMLASTAMALTLTAPVTAETIFTLSSDGFVGRVQAGGTQPNTPVYAGEKAVISGQDMTPGQEITLYRGNTALNADGPITVDAEGKFSFELTVDADALTGLQPIVVVAEKPAAAEVVTLKISPKLEVAGADKYTILSEPVTRGLYQVAYSEKSHAIFVTAAVGRPPVKDSKLVKADPDTLKVLAEVVPAAAPARTGPDGQPQEGGVFAVYGVAVDDANGTVWVTNTRQNTVAVYSQADLSLVKQFEPGATEHSRDVVIDSVHGRAYVSEVGAGTIAVFDTKTLEQLDPISITSGERGETFSAMSLDLDSASGVLTTVSMGTNELAVIDPATGEAKVTPIPPARGASGVAYDAQDGLVFVASQQSDSLTIVKADSGEVVADVEVGAGALNVTFDPVGRLAYVANRTAGTIAVVDTTGAIVANLDAGSYPNQLVSDEKGALYAVNKSRGEDDPAGDRLWKITPAN